MPNIHLHYLRKTTVHSDWSVGLGYESILGEHAHQTITALVNYELVPRFTINAGPGISFGTEDGHSHVGLSGHVELLYEFTIGGFHLGPMAGFGFDKDDSHASLGLHFGFGF